ncbi:MAG: hypothetical protein M1824_002125 [Vezdaea acicularis]|nr:MAG: hypothetical protein M1824_002125 [Vezdaea acicularis]
MAGSGCIFRIYTDATGFVFAMVVMVYYGFEKLSCWVPAEERHPQVDDPYVSRQARPRRSSERYCRYNADYVEGSGLAGDSESTVGSSSI